MEIDNPKLRLTTNKTRILMDKGYEISGFVLMHPKTGERQIVELSAVRKLTNDEMWSLMHPTDAPKKQPTTIKYEGHELVLCPFCGGGEYSIRPCGRVWLGSRYSEPSSVEVMHYCPPVLGQPSRPIVRVGRDLESAIAAWNLRAHQKESL